MSKILWCESKKGLQQHYIGIFQEGGGAPEQCDRLVGRIRLISFQVMSEIPQSLQAILTRLIWGMPPYSGRLNGRPLLQVSTAVLCLLRMLW